MKSPLIHTLKIKPSASRVVAFSRGILLCSLLSAVWAPRAAGADYFTVTRVNLGGTAGTVQALAPAGQATGGASLPNGGNRHGHLTTSAGITDIGTLAGHDYSGGLQVNSAGVVLGFSGNVAASENTRVVRWTASGGMVDLSPTRPLALLAWPLLNEAGQIVAVTRELGTLNYRATVWPAPGGVAVLTFPGAAGHSFHAGMNASGQVVGNSQGRAFSWTAAGGMVDLLPSASSSEALLVNDSGRVAGTHRPSQFTAEAFTWTQPTGPVFSGSLGGTYTAPRAMNSAGQIAGYSRLTGSIYPFHAFLWTPGESLIDLTPGDTRSSAPRALTDNGIAIGHFVSADQSTSLSSFVWTQAGGLVELNLAGDPCFVTSWNSAGKVAGYSRNSTGQTRAFSWTASTGVTDLGTLGGSSSVALTVLPNGNVTGYSYVSGSTNSRAFLHDGAAMVDLNSRIVNAPAGLVLESSAYQMYEDARNFSSVAFVAYAGGQEYLVSPSLPGPAAPVVGPVLASLDPVPVGAMPSLSATFTDVNTTDTHTAVWQWGDNTATTAGAVSESAGSGNVTGAHTFAAAGIYDVSVAVTDSTGRIGYGTRQVVVYDPLGGFVTGAGWISSPMGAYKEQPTLAGRASFAFVSKYQRGATVPSGTTDFNFRAADLSFRSTSYEWLVVAGARAQFKGSGTINDEGSFKFLLTGVDGDKVGGGVADRFRIKIWYYDAEAKQDVVVYDNQINTSQEGGALEGTAIGGGSIMIQVPKK